MFAFVFADLARLVIEGPRFRNLCGDELDHDIERPDPLEIIGYVRAYAERGLAIVFGILLSPLSMRRPLNWFAKSSEKFRLKISHPKLS